MMPNVCFMEINCLHLVGNRHGAYDSAQRDQTIQCFDTHMYMAIGQASVTFGIQQGIYVAHLIEAGDTFATVTTKDSNVLRYEEILFLRKMMSG